MARLFQSMHARSSHERRRFSLRMAASITVAVFLVWLVTLPMRLASIGQKEGAKTAESGASLVAAAGAAVSSIGDRFGELKAQVSSPQYDGGAAGSAPAAAPATVLSGSDAATQ